MGVTDNDVVVRGLHERGLFHGSPKLFLTQYAAFPQTLCSAIAYSRPLSRRRTAPATNSKGETLPQSVSPWARYAELSKGVVTLDLVDFFGDDSIADWIVKVGRGIASCGVFRIVSAA